MATDLQVAALKLLDGKGGWAVDLVDEQTGPQRLISLYKLRQACWM